MSVETIKNIESEKHNVKDETEEKIVKVFEAAGLEFITEGVRKRTPCPQCGFVKPD